MARSTDPEREARFTELLERHADTVHRYLVNRHYAGDPLDAEDLLAEVFAIAWRRLDDVPSEAEAPWLVGVARNRLLNMRTKQRRRLGRAALVRPPSVSSPGAEDEVVADMALRQAIADLSVTERETLLLNVWEGFSTAEIGLVLGISENAVRIRLSRAKSDLLARLVRGSSESDRILTKETE